MGFKLQTSPTFWKKVTLAQTGEDGKVVEGDFKVQFHRKTKDEIKALSEEVAGKEVTVDHVMPLMSAWRDYTDATGAEVTFSKDAFENLSQRVPGSPAAILTAFLHGSAGAREGN